MELLAKKINSPRTITIALFFLLLFPINVFASSEPTVLISADKSSYTYGETVYATVEVISNGVSSRANLYARIVLANGTTLYYPNWQSTPKPAIRFRKITNWGPKVLFNYTLEGSEAMGEYTLEAFLTNPKTNEVIGEIGSDSFTLEQIEVELPVANFISDVGSGKSPLQVTFKDLSAKNITSWAWDFNNDGIIDSTEQNPTYTYTSDGTYTVKLTVKNANGSDDITKDNYVIVENHPNREMIFWRASGDEWGTEAIVGNIPKEDEVINDLNNYYIKRVIASYGSWTNSAGEPIKSEAEKDQIAAWNLKLHNNGMESQVVFGDYSSIFPESPERQKLRAKVLEILNFNSSRINPLERIDIINLDVEPQALSGWKDGSADKKQYLYYLLDTYQDIRNLMDNNNASNMRLYAFIGHHFDKMPEIGGKVNWSSQEERDDWFYAVKNTLSNVIMMTYELGSLNSLLSVSEYERGVFPNAEFCLNVKDIDPIGTTWADLNEFLDMINQIETSVTNLTGMHSYRYFKPYLLQPNLPVAAFSADCVSGPSPLSVQFKDLSLNIPTSWAWDFDNDGIIDSTEQNPLYTYTSPGSYSVKLTVTNENGSNEKIEENYIDVYDDSIHANLIAYYKMDGNLYDSTTNHLDLEHYTYNGSSEVASSPTFSSEAFSGQAIYFDGDISQNALRGDNFRTYLSSGFTYTAWIKIPQSAINDDSKRGIIGQGLAPYLIKNRSGQLEARIDFLQPDEQESKIYISSSSLLPADHWTQVALTWYPTTDTLESNIALYINGNRVAEANSPYITLNCDPRLAIGKISTSMYFFNGLIDEVKIYSTSLTETQIYNEYQAEVDSVQ